MSQNVSQETVAFRHPRVEDHSQPIYDANKSYQASMPNRESYTHALDSMRNFDTYRPNAYEKATHGEASTFLETVPWFALGLPLHTPSSEYMEYARHKGELGAWSGPSYTNDMRNRVSLGKQWLLDHSLSDGDEFVSLNANSHARKRSRQSHVAENVADGNVTQGYKAMHDAVNGRTQSGTSPRARIGNGPQPKSKGNNVKKQLKQQKQKNKTKAAKKLVARVTKRETSKVLQPQMTTISRNVAMPSSSRNRLMNRPQTVSNREFIGTLYSNTGFNLGYSIPLNPGLSATFPWLAPIATRYEFYQFKFLGFEFVSSAASTETGNVLFGVDYDAEDAPPTNKMSMTGCYTNRSGSPVESFGVVLRPKPKNRPASGLKVRSATVVEDLNETDLGTMYIAAFGNVANSVALGDIYVTYEVELNTQKNENIGSQFAIYGGLTSVGNVTSTTPLGATSTSTQPGSTLTLTLINALQFRVPRTGRYLMTYSVGGTSGVVMASNFVAAQGATLIRNGFYGSATSSQGTAVATIDITDSALNLISIPLPGTVVSSTGAIVMVSAIPGDVTLGRTQQVSTRVSELEEKLRVLLEERKEPSLPQDTTFVSSSSSTPSPAPLRTTAPFESYVRVSQSPVRSKT